MTSFKGDKLVGKSNYMEWLNPAELYLEINGYMPYINGSANPPMKDLYYDRVEKKEVDIKDPSRSTSSWHWKAYSPELAVKYQEKKEQYDAYNQKALGALKSIISLENQERFKDRKTAKELWEAIKATFGSTSLEQIGRYINKIVDTNYSSYKSIDEYTSVIQSSAIYLKQLKCDIPKPVIASLILKGLPSSFDSFSSRKYEEISNDLDAIDLQGLITDLISEEARMGANADLNANKAFNNRGKHCTHCKNKGHIYSECFILHPELRPNNSSNSSNANNNYSNKKKSFYKGRKTQQAESKENSSKALMRVATTTTRLPSDDKKVTSSLSFKGKNNHKKSNPLLMGALINIDDFTESSKQSKKEGFRKLALITNYDNKLVLDSGASEHYTPNKNWLLNYKPISNKSITIANGDKMPVLGIGDIPIKANNLEILIQKVNYIPSLNTTLISSRELTEKNWSINFNKTGAIIRHKCDSFDC